MGCPVRKVVNGDAGSALMRDVGLATRLIEAGARVVTLNYSKWDWHGGFNAEGRADNTVFVREREDFPIFDNCVSGSVFTFSAIGQASSPG